MTRRLLAAMAVLTGLFMGAGRSEADPLLVSELPTGNILNYVGPNTPGTPNPFATGLGATRDMVFDSDGNLYVAIGFPNNTIARITPSGVVSTFASTGLNEPIGLAIDSAGNLYVANDAGNTISRITPSGVVSTFAATGLSQPVDVAFDSAGNLYAGNFGAGNITKYNSAGTQVDANGNPTSLPFALTAPQPYGLTFDSSDNLYVTVEAFSLTSGAVQRFNSQGMQSSIIATELTRPRGLTIDSDGNLLMVSAGIVGGFTPDGRILQFTLDGTPLPDFVSTGLRNPDFIVLSSVVPEPASLTLLGLGLVSLLGYTWHRRNRTA